MYGVQGTNTALKAMATALGKGVEKKLNECRSYKGNNLPNCKKCFKMDLALICKTGICRLLSKNAIPVVGGVIGGWYYISII